MTRRLYDEDSFCREFTATVIGCEPRGDGCAVVLDRTAFFPEGGGQASDTGTLDGIAVTDVQTDGETVIHMTAAPLTVGQTVTGRIDWEQRFSRMQKHTGEHIISGLVYTLYGLHNVGFHLGSEDVTMDYDGELTREQLDRIETLANEAVTRDVPVTAVYPSAEELTALSYRSKKELSGAIRIVTVEGYDVCACCAPHVAHTGQIGLIKILDFARYKGGVRVHMQAGADALADYRMRYEQTATAANMLSVKPSELTGAISRIAAQRDEAVRQLARCRREMALAQVERVSPDTPYPCLITDTVDGDTLMAMATALRERSQGGCAVFAGADGQGYTYVILADGGLRELATEIGRDLGGRGGGSEQMLRGRADADAGSIRTFWKERYPFTVG